MVFPNLLSSGGTRIHFTQLPTFPACAALLGVVLLGAVLLVAGCEKETTTFIPTPGTVEQYQRYCSVCHSDKRTGAPLAGDRQAWDERVDKGMQIMMTSTIEGMGNMPPLGLCFECSRDEFEALINYMQEGEFEQ